MNASKHNKFHLVYIFFYEMQALGKLFSSKDIAEKTGWSMEKDHQRK